MSPVSGKQDSLVSDLETMSLAVNYRDWIFDTFKPYLGSRIIEIGSGIGNFTSLLLDRELVVAIDNHLPSLDILKSAFAGNEQVIPLDMDIASPEMLELRKYCPDSIICINVLEHVERDDQALSNAYELLDTGGNLLLLVPAFQFLFGSIDRVVGHHRRYNRKQLCSLLEGAGFSVVDLHYMNFIAPAGWFLNNRILKRQEESRSQVLFFDRYVVPWLRRVEGLVHPPFGLSLVAIARKQ